MGCPRGITSIYVKHGAKKWGFVLAVDAACVRFTISQ